MFLARLIVSPAAKQDLVEAFLYIAQDNLDAAVRVHTRIHKAFSAIARQPRIGGARSDLMADARSLAAGRYVIYYRYTKDSVRILLVLHGARDQKSALE